MAFFGLNIAVRGLYTAQRALDIVNHNLNNVNTPGYSRQEAVQQAAMPLGMYDGTGMIGTGSEIVETKRIRDEYIDSKYWSENVAAGEWNAKKEALSDIESTFNEPSDSGFNKVLDEFYATLQELSKDPSNAAIRSVVSEKGVTVAKYFNSVATHFEKLQDDIDNRIVTKVGEVNSLAEQIQNLNQQIYSSELNGNAANDLRDERTLLVDKLSKIVNISVQEVSVGKLVNGMDDKHFSISIGGKNLVDHFGIAKLAVKTRDVKLNTEDISNLSAVEWEDKNKLSLKSGELKGLIDIRDGNEGKNGSPLYKGIPYYIKKINEFVRTFAKAFNEGIAAGTDGVGHADGYGIASGGSGTVPTGIRFFTMKDENGNTLDSAAFINGAASTAEIEARYDQVTARNFTVSSDILNNYNNISTSTQPGEASNTGVLSEILEQRHNPHLFADGAPEDFMKSLVSNLGIDSQQAERFADNQAVIMSQIENRRVSESGVSVDEEMTNLVKYQQAYHASAKMIETMQDVYDILINRLGV